MIMINMTSCDKNYSNVKINIHVNKNPLLCEIFYLFFHQSGGHIGNNDLHIQLIDHRDLKEEET